MKIGQADQKLPSVVVLVTFGVGDDVDTLLQLYVEAVMNECFSFVWQYKPWYKINFFVWRLVWWYIP